MFESDFVLYGTSGCHLCELAMEEIKRVQTLLPVQVMAIDIAESDELVEDYGLKIPVLRHIESGKELGWPFDAQQLYCWILPLNSQSGR
jgi:thiol-disulfide isomerase/thioredoxin